ncbi:MAG: GNAT family N-acetyltransferase [Clostridiales bacterium]|nr:GNAT family N-acetyltransferase [Clostridiales bacterium]
MEFELKKWRLDYIKEIAEYANNKNIADNLRNAFPYPYTLDDAKYYVNHCMRKEGESQICRAIVINKKAIGSVGVFFRDDVYSKTGEIGYWLAEEFWGRGIMNTAISKVCKIVFDEYDIIRIHAEPFADNIGSRKALEKAGFMLEGIMKNNVIKNNKVLDSCMYAKLK